MIDKVGKIGVAAGVGGGGLIAGGSGMTGAVPYEWVMVAMIAGGVCLIIAGVCCTFFALGKVLGIAKRIKKG